MVNPFELVAQRLAELGFFDFLLPWMITSAIFYGALRKTKILGESVGIIATLSLAFSFLIWGYLISVPSVSLGVPLSKFITQFSVLAIVFLVSLLGASLFYPDFSATLEKTFPGGTMILVAISVVLILFFTTSGLGGIIGLQQTLFRGSAGTLLLVFFFIFIGVLIASLLSGGGW